jgi:hypothetical protein
MVNYQNGKIYKLWSPSKNIIYIGSTTQPLCKRLVCHLSNYKAYNKDHSKKYLTSYLVLDCEDYKIELLEECNCNNRQQLEKKEGEHIRNNECVNRCIVGRTDKQYYLDNIEKKKEYSKQYIIDNAEKIKEYKKQYTTDNRDKINEYNKLRNQTEARKAYNKEYHKQYRLKKKLEQNKN